MSVTMPTRPPTDPAAAAPAATGQAAAAAGTGAGTDGGAGPTAPRGPRRATTGLLAAELGYGLLGLVTVLGCARLFLGWDFAGPLVVASLASTFLCVGARRLGWHVLLTAAVSLVALAVATGVLLYRDTMRWAVLPTTATWDAAQADLAAAFSAWNTTEAPVPADGGFLLMALVAVWVIAFVRDAFAFRAEAGTEALVPDLLLFVVAAALGTDRLRVPVAVAFFAAAALAYLAHRLWHQERTAGWLASRRTNVVLAVLGRASVIVAVAGLAAALVAPALPVVTGSRLIDVTPGAGGGDGRRVALSPLVEIRGRLAGESQVPVLRVRSSAPSYWRAMALDEFTGDQWRVDAELRRAAGDLPGRPEGPGREVVQQMEVQGLTGLFLPAALLPVRIDSPAAVSFDPSLATLVTEGDDVSGLQYTVTSFLPTYTAEELRAASGTVPGAVADRFLQLPDDFPADLRAQAAEIVRGAASPYDQALLLQQWFRTGFTYDLSFRAGSGTDAIRSFLTGRRGYCEQFAGTFAAFARAVGLPARVAVGFTAGERVATNTYQVYGRHAHAWPEVYLAGVGWVPFEPTPSRGAPGAEGWTGVPAQQDGEVVLGDQSTVPSTTVASGSATTLPTNVPDAGLEDLPGIALPGDSGLSTGAPADDGPPWWRALVAPLGVLALLAAGWAVAVPSLRAWRRAVHRRRAGPGAGQVQAAWEEAGRELRMVGLAPVSSETPLEHARRVRDAGSRAETVAPSVERLASLVTTARYAGGTVADTDVDDARHEAAAVARTLHRARRRHERVLRVLDPRDLVR